MFLCFINWLFLNMIIKKLYLMIQVLAMKMNTKNISKSKTTTILTYLQLTFFNFF